MRFSISFLTILMTFMTPPVAQAGCMLFSDPSRDALFEKYQNAAVLIQTTGSNQSLCENSGTGLLVSDDGQIVTAKHVIPTNCPDPLRITARFAWDLSKSYKINVVKEAPLDAILLRIDDLKQWQQNSPKLCLPAWSDSEAKMFDEFIWFGRADPVPIAQRYVGSVMSTSTNSGRSPFQMVCAAINPSDSGGPIISARSGSFVGVMVERIMNDQNGRVINDRGLILPSKFIAPQLGISGLSDNSCEEAGNQTFDLNNPIKSGYQFIVTIPDNSAEYTVLRIVKPYDQFRFLNVEQIALADGNGNSVPIDAICTPEARNCVEYKSDRNSITVAMNFRFDSKSDSRSRILSLTASQIIDPDIAPKVAGLSKDAALRYLSEIQSRPEYLAVDGPTANIVSKGENGEAHIRQIPKDSNGIFIAPQQWKNLMNNSIEFQDKIRSPINFYPNFHDINPMNIYSTDPTINSNDQYIKYNWNKSSPDLNKTQLDQILNYDPRLTNWRYRQFDQTIIKNQTLPNER